jgi:hypothetical protein
MLELFEKLDPSLAMHITDPMGSMRVQQHPIFCLEGAKSKADL